MAENKAAAAPAASEEKEEARKTPDTVKVKNVSGGDLFFPTGTIEKDKTAEVPRSVFLMHSAGAKPSLKRVK